MILSHPLLEDYSSMSPFIHLCKIIATVNFMANRRVRYAPARQQNDKGHELFPF